MKLYTMSSKREESLILDLKMCATLIPKQVHVITQNGMGEDENEKNPGFPMPSCSYTVTNDDWADDGEDESMLMAFEEKIKELETQNRSIPRNVNELNPMESSTVTNMDELDDWANDGVDDVLLKAYESTMEKVKTGQVNKLKEVAQSSELNTQLKIESNNCFLKSQLKNPSIAQKAPAQLQPASVNKSTHQSKPMNCVNLIEGSIHSNSPRVNRMLKRALNFETKKENLKHCRSSVSAMQAIRIVSSPKERQSTQSTSSNFNLSNETMQTILKTKGITGLYNWQEECLNKAMTDDKNLLYALPTSGGKTLVAEILMIREVLRKKKDCICVLPYVSIVQEKIRTLSSLALQLGFDLEEYAGNQGKYPPRKRKIKQVIYIATIEKALGIVNALIELDRLSEIGLVVVDEIHMIDEGSRGATLEILLVELLVAKKNPRIIAMSATVGNLEEIGTFLKSDVYTSTFRPVNHKQYIKSGDRIFQINENEKCDQKEMFVNSQYCGQTDAMRKRDPDDLCYLVNEVLPDHSVLVFCSTKKHCESVCKLLVKNLPSYLLRYRAVEKETLKRSLRREAGQLCSILDASVPFGVAYHHAGLTADERQLVEDAYNSKILSVLCCTSTLAAGVNLPARRVIIRTPYVGRSLLNKSQYQQMVGRAGRAGFTTEGESILMVAKKDLPAVTSNILVAPLCRVKSQLAHNERQGLQELILSLIHLGLCGNTHASLCETILRSTLLGMQSVSPVSTLVEESLRSMVDQELIEVVNGGVTLTKLGRAAWKGNVEGNRAKQIYTELRNPPWIRTSSSKLPLLYLIVPYDFIGKFHIDGHFFAQIFFSLSPDDEIFALSLGINTAAVIHLRKNGPMLDFTQPINRIIARFYITLILRDLYNGSTLWDMAETYGCSRGDLQNLFSCSSRFAISLNTFMGEWDAEFCEISKSLESLSHELHTCRIQEIIPLLELPAIANGRAHLLFQGGFKSLEDVANSTAEELMNCGGNLTKPVANCMIAAAKVLLQERLDTMREETENSFDEVEHVFFNDSISQVTDDSYFTDVDSCC